MDTIEKSAMLFKTLGDSTRLKIVKAVCNEEKSVTAIASELRMSQSAISHQLKTLRQSDIVKSNRKGKEVFYGLSDYHVKVIMEQVFSHTSHNSNEQ